MVATSSPPSASSTPSSSLTRDFAALLATPAAAPSSAPSTSPSGGVEAPDVPAVAHGKSVVVLPSVVTSAMFCCASIGEGESQKVCLVPAGTCSIQAHSSAARKLVLSPGIYFQAGSPTKVYCQPCGAPSLLATHRDAIMELVTDSLGDWISWLNTWKMSATEAEATLRRVTINEAKMAQTPAKNLANNTERKLDMLFIDTLDAAGPDIETFDLEDHVAAYEAMWRASAGSVDTELPATFALSTFIKDIATRQEKATALLHNLTGAVQADRKLLLSLGEATEVRVTELELLGLSSFPNIKEKVLQAASATTALEDKVRLMSDQVNRSATLVSQHDSELQEIFSNIKSFKEVMENKMKAMQRTLDRLEGDVTGGSYDALAAEFSEAQTVVHNLKKERIADRLRIESLEARISTGKEEIAVGSHKVRSAHDLLALFKNEGAEAVDFGGFIDVYNFFIRIHSRSKGETSMEDHYKHKKDIKSLNLSEDEATAFYSFTVTAPAPFHGKKNKKSDIPALDTAEKWKNKKLLIGVGYEIERTLDQVHQDIALIIELAYNEFPTIAALANVILLKSVEFVSAFVRWTDDTFESLTAGGNLKEDVWWITTKVMRSIFEDYLAPARATPTTTSFESDLFRKCTMLWGVIKSHLAVSTMLKRGIKDHPIVVGAYAQWLVSNSGRKEALDAHALIKSLSSKVDGISSSLKDATSTLSDVKASVVSVKKTADSALNKVGALKQGGKAN